MGKYLKEIIEEEGISQAELSRASGVSTTTINKICQKNFKGSNISPTTKGKLIKALNKIIENKRYSIQDVIL
jgi:transcriptional regulator with XRE-family HTH domain